MAYKKSNYLQTSLNIAEDNSCAEGPKNPDDNCRMKQTNILFEEHNTNKNTRVATLNDKLISRCVNGAWTQPSHECICSEEKSRRESKALVELVCEIIETPTGNTGRADDTDAPIEESSEESSNSNRAILTTCGLLPAFFFNM